jgi:hypothetical protein
MPIAKKYLCKKYLSKNTSPEALRSYSLLWAIASMYHAELIELFTWLQAKSLRSRDAVHPATQYIYIDILRIKELNPI